MTTDAASVNTTLQEDKLQSEDRRKAYRLDMLCEEFGAFADNIEHARTTGSLIGPITGFDSVDRELCGALYPGLHVVTGNTGAGKTAFCLQVACQCGFPALYVTCEMSALELLRRITARVTETPLHQFKNPREALPAALMKKKVEESIRAAPHLVIADSTLAFWDANAILEEAERLKKTLEFEHILVVIDSLHAWASWLPSEEYDRLNVALKSFRMIAAELKCPVLYIAEQSKAANMSDAQGKGYGSAAPAGFRGIEYGAESLIGLRAKTDEKGKPITDAYGVTPVTLTFHKNRNGAAGKPIPMKFDGAFQKFSEDDGGEV